MANSASLPDPNMLLLHLAPPPKLSPTAAIENTPQFRKAAQTAWDRVRSATAFSDTPIETGFTVDAQGIPSHMTTSTSEAGNAASTAQKIHPSDAAAFHVHPDMPGYNQKPSPADIAVAKQVKRPIMVMSREGLFEVDAQGNVRQVFRGTKWLSSKFRPTQ